MDSLTISKIDTLSINVIDTLHFYEVAQPKSLNSWFENPDSIITILAVTISLTALLFSIFYSRITFNLTKKHNTLSVKPLLHISVNRDKDNAIRYTLYNYGYGPALIERLDYSYKGETAQSMDKLIERLKPRLQTKTPLNLRINAVEYKFKSVIPINNERIIVEIKFPDETYINSFINILRNVEVNFFFSDLYGNKYQGEFNFDID